MNRVRIVTRVIPLLVGIGLAVSGCAVEPVGYVGVGRPVGYYDGFFYGGWGHGFAHRGFGGHGGFGEHGGGGHGGGGHGGGGHGGGHGGGGGHR